MVSPTMIPVNPDSLPSYELGGLYSGMNAAQAQFDNEQATKKTLMDLMQADKMNPMLLEQQRMQNEGLQNSLNPELVAAQRAKAIADSQKAGYEAQGLEKTWKSDAETKLAENKTKQQADQVKQYKSKMEGVIQRMMSQPNGWAVAMQEDPELAKDMAPYGADAPKVFLDRYKQLKDMEAKLTPEYIKELEQSRSKKEVAGMQIAGNKALEQMRIDAGKYDKAKNALTIQQMILKADNPTKAVEAYTKAANEALRNGDVEESLRYTALAKDANTRKTGDWNNKVEAAKAGSFNLASQGIDVRQPAQPSGNVGVNTDAITQFILKKANEAGTTEERTYWMQQLDGLGKGNPSQPLQPNKTNPNHFDMKKY